jgi:hypothetical protein
VTPKGGDTITYKTLKWSSLLFRFFLRSGNLGTFKKAKWQLGSECPSNYSTFTVSIASQSLITTRRWACRNFYLPSSDSALLSLMPTLWNSFPAFDLDHCHITTTIPNPLRGSFLAFGLDHCHITTKIPHPTCKSSTVQWPTTTNTHLRYTPHQETSITPFAHIWAR